MPGGGWANFTPGQFVGEPIVPQYLIRQREVRVGAAWIGYDEQVRGADTHWLRTQRAVGSRRRKRAVQMPVAGHAMEAGDARSIARKLAHQVCHTKGQLLRPQIAGPRGGALDQIGETEAERGKFAIVYWFQSCNPKRPARRLAQSGPREAWPEAIAPPGKVVAL